MKKQKLTLNEELSQMKRMMGKLMNEDNNIEDEPYNPIKKAHSEYESPSDRRYNSDDWVQAQRDAEGKKDTIDDVKIKVAKVNWDNKGNLLATPNGDVIKSEGENDEFLVFINGDKIYYARNLNTDKLVEINPNDIEIIKDYDIDNDKGGGIYAIKLFNDKINNGDIADGVAEIIDFKKIINQKDSL